MSEGSLEVNGVMMSPAVSTYVEHPRPPQIANQSPHGPLRQSHLVGDLTDGALWIDGNVKQDCAVAGYQVPVILNGQGLAAPIVALHRSLIHVMQSLLTICCSFIVRGITYVE